MCCRYDGPPPDQSVSNSPPPDPPISNTHSPIGAIVGGAVGGAVGLMALAFCGLIIRRRIRRHPLESARLTPFTEFSPDANVNATPAHSQSISKAARMRREELEVLRQSQIQPDTASGSGTTAQNSDELFRALEEMRIHMERLQTQQREIIEETRRPPVYS